MITEILKKPNLVMEFYSKQLNKHGEELCGDSIKAFLDKNHASIVLSDGLGSGVKANILANLSTSIITIMLENGADIKDVVETLVQTLPVCQVRRIAYSTFTIIQIDDNGIAKIVEYDNPPTILLRKRKVIPIEYKDTKISNKTIKSATIKLQDGDSLITFSDGEIHAGIGMKWNLGWSWERIAKYLEETTKETDSAKDITNSLSNTAYKLYGKEPGDDTSVASIKFRKIRKLNLMVGAPINKENDDKVVNSFLKKPGKKILCGGTTSKIVSRILNKKIDIDLSSMNESIPPIGRIEGIDLCTEGICTLTHILSLFRKSLPIEELSNKRNGANLLYRELLKADLINIYVGQAINPAHQNPSMPVEFGMKTRIVGEIAKKLSVLGKKINIKYH